MINNAVTVGATVLNNNSATYASFAILMDQTLARQARRFTPVSKGFVLPERALHRNGAQ